MLAAVLGLWSSLTLTPNAETVELPVEGETEVVTLACGMSRTTLREKLTESAVVVRGSWICVEADALAADSLEYIDVDEIADGSVPWTVDRWFEQLERYVASDLEEEVPQGRLELEPATRSEPPRSQTDEPRRLAVGIRVDAALKGDAPAWIPIDPIEGPDCRKSASERRKLVVHASFSRDEDVIVPLVLETSWVSENATEAKELQQVLARGLELLAAGKTDPRQWRGFILEAVAHPATRWDALLDLYQDPDGSEGESVFETLTEEEFRRLESAYVTTLRGVGDAWDFIEVFEDRPSPAIDRATARVVAAALELDAPSLDDAEDFGHVTIWYLASNLARRTSGSAGSELLANLALDEKNDDTIYWRMMWPVIEAFLLGGGMPPSPQPDPAQP